MVVGSSTEKAVLLALAYRHNEDLDRAYPSVASICEFTELNRKTVIAALGKLEAKGLIADSGERVGRTKSVIAYRLLMDQKTEQSQNGDRLKTDRSSPNFSGKQSQKRDTERDRKTTSESKDSSDSGSTEPELGLGLPPIPPKDPTPSDVADFIAAQWGARAFVTPIRGGRPSQPHAEKALDLGKKSAVGSGSALDTWGEIFAAMDRSDFLQGKVPGRDGRPPFKLTLSFLLEKRNFEKTLEGRFDGQSTGERRRGSTSEATGRVLDRIRSGSAGRAGGRDSTLAISGR